MTTVSLSATGRQTLSPNANRGSMLMKLSIASPPLKPIAASVAKVSSQLTVAFARRAAIGLGEMDVFKVVASGYDAVAHALFLDVHMIGVEMDEDIVRADPLDQRNSLRGRIDDVVLVAVDGFHAEFDAPCLGVLGGSGHDLRDVVDLALGRRHAGSLADAAIDYARKAPSRRGRPSCRWPP